MPKIGEPTKRISALKAFILERYSIRTKKAAGEPKPWTDDSILQTFRFCNTHREYDRETIWIREHWREPHSSDPDLWFAMVVARLVNWHPSLEELGYPVPWKPKRFVRILDSRRRRGEKTFTSAYTTPAPPAGGSKAEHIAAKVLAPLWQNRESLREISQGTLAQAHKRLMKYDGLGSFTAAQVIADLKYVEPLSNASDWWTWAASGPGSRRGLNRVLRRETNSTWVEFSWLHELKKLHRTMERVLKNKVPRLHAQDLQNCLCEWDKHERVRLGEGKPRQKYQGK